MKILPVLDLLDGVVVHGIAGQRDRYRPIESPLAPDARPLTVARAFRDKLGLQSLYVADLDAIRSDRPHVEAIRRLAEEGFEIMVDAGLRDVDRAQTVLGTGASSVIAGLETCRGPESLRRLCEICGPERVIFSLDLTAGRPLGDVRAWATAEPFEIAGRAVGCGVQQMIVLDLAQVGSHRGPSTAGLCRRLRGGFPDLRLITGGGVRNAADLAPLQELRLDGVLLASALHQGTIGREEIAALASVDQSAISRGGAN